MSLRAGFVGLLQSRILKTTEVLESPSMVARSQQVWSQTWDSEHSGHLHKELCKAGQDIWQPKHPQPGCIWGTLPHTKNFSGRLCVRKEEKQQNQNTTDLHTHAKVALTPQGIPHHPIISAVACREGSPWAGMKSRDM